MVTYDNDKIYAKVWGFCREGRREIKSAKEKVDYQKLEREGAALPAAMKLLIMDL